MVYNGKAYENGWVGATAILGHLHSCTAVTREHDE